MSSSPLTNASWLAKHLDDPDLVVLDASIPKVGQVGPHPLAEVSIPGARFFDLDGVFSDHSTNLPHSLPTPEAFERECRRLGVHTNSRVVVYDHHGIYCSPRVWWMFRVMGHEAVSVLDGGLPKWIAAGHPTQPGPNREPSESGNFSARLTLDLASNAESLLSNVESPTAKVLDARSRGRFLGIDPEPRAGLVGGHIPGSINLPFDQVLRDGCYLPPEELSEVFAKLDLGDAPLVFTCGSGVTACVIMLASEVVLDNPKSVYDGSWAEWGQPENKWPIASQGL